MKTPADRSDHAGVKDVANHFPHLKDDIQYVLTQSSGLSLAHLLFQLLD